MDKILLKNIDRENSQDINVYLAGGGYHGLKKALAMKPEEVFGMSVDFLIIHPMKNRATIFIVHLLSSVVNIDQPDYSYYPIIYNSEAGTSGHRTAARSSRMLDESSFITKTIHLAP